jgi:hypothetical protein
MLPITIDRGCAAYSEAAAAEAIIAAMPVELSRWPIAPNRSPAANQIADIEPKKTARRPTGRPSSDALRRAATCRSAMDEYRDLAVGEDLERLAAENDRGDAVVAVTDQ